MQKLTILVFYMMFFAFAFANNIQSSQNVESSVKIKIAIQQLDDQFVAKGVPVMSEPYLLKENNNDLKVIENLVNKDIGLTIYNQTNDIIKIKSISYLVDKTTCATSNDINKDVLPKEKIYGYFISRNYEIKCYSNIENTVLKEIGGNYVLNDVAPNVRSRFGNAQTFKMRMVCIYVL